MEDLNDEVTEADGRLFIGLRWKEMLCNFYYLFSFHKQQDFFMAYKNEILESSGSVQEQEHVFGFPDEIEKLREDWNYLLKVFWMLLSICFLQ